jgi:hypothetical protein
MNTPLKNDLKSFLSRLCNDSYAGTMFEGDADTLRDAIAYIDLNERIKLRAAAPKECATAMTDDVIYQMAKDAGFFLHDEQLKLEFPIGYSEAQKRMLKFARAIIAQSTPAAVAQEPVARITGAELGYLKNNCIDELLPVGTELYAAPQQPVAAIEPMPQPLIVDASHPNPAYVTLGFADKMERVAFMKAVQSQPSASTTVMQDEVKNEPE